MSLSRPSETRRYRRKATPTAATPSLPFETIADAVPLIVWTVDRRGSLEYVNDRWRDFTGQSPSLALGLGWMISVHPQDLGRHARAWARALARGTSLEVEVRLRRFDGKYRWHQIRGRSSQDALGNVVRLVGTATDVEEQRVLAARLAEERRKIERILGAAPLIVSSVDRDGTLVFCDGRGLEAVGFHRKDLVGRSFFEAFGSGSRPLVTSMRRALDGESHTAVAEVFGRWYETLFAPIRSETGHVEGVACVSTDITGEKRAEDRLRSALQAANMGYWEYDLRGSTFTCNVRALELFGLTPETWDGTYEAILARIHPEDLPGKRLAFDRAVATSSDYDIEYRTMYGEGRIRWIAAKGRCTKDAQGLPLRFTGVAYDVTDKRETLLRLEESEERFRLAARATTGLVYDWDLRTGVVWRSEGFTQILGIAPDEVPDDAKWWREQIHPEDVQRVGPLMDAILQGTDVHYEYEYRVRHRDGRWLQVWDRGHILRDPHTREPVRVVGVTLDVSASQKAKEALEEAVRARDEFLSIASHELKTPLTSMRLQSQSVGRQLKRSGGKPFEACQVKSLIESNERQIHRLARLVDDMLDISRLKAGKFALRRERCDLLEVLGDVCERFASQFLEITGEVPQVPSNVGMNGYWDRDRLEQVVANVLTNSLRYGRGKPIAIETRSEPAHVVFSVRDQGIGIAAEYRDRIFNCFERAVPSNEVSGLGLGLYITKQIVDGHGGTITVESELGQGSTFHVRLPRAPEPESS